MFFSRGAAAISLGKAFLNVSSAMILAASLTSCGGDKDSPTPPPVSVSPPPNSAPVLTGNFKPEFLENSDVIFTLNIEDADGDTVTVTIGDSQDGHFFTVDSATGEIQSTQQFDFENPQDENSDNIYVQTVTLDDGTTTVTEQVEVAILNEDEAAPECDILSDISVDENTTGLLATFSGTDQDPGDEAIAIFENLTLSQSELDGLIDLNPSTGQVSLNTPLDSEALGSDFTFDITADYRTNDLFDTCTVTVALNDLPARVTSGIILGHPSVVADNRKHFEILSDINGDGFEELWVENGIVSGGYYDGLFSGSLIFGQTFSDTISTNEEFIIDVEMLGLAEKIIIEAYFYRGVDEGGAFYSNEVFVKTISDVDGDGITDFFIGSLRPPNDQSGRNASAFIVFAKTINENDSGTIFLNDLTDNQAITLRGKANNNGSYIQYIVANLDGVSGDEIAISGTRTPFYVISNEALTAGSGNIDYDNSPMVKVFETNPNLENATVAGISVLGDLDGDNAIEIAHLGGPRTTLIPSAKLIASTGGNARNLNTLILDHSQGEVWASYSYGTADIDGDSLPDLLISPLRFPEPGLGTIGLIIKGEALAPILNSN